jgi:hypothetical protein
MSATALLRCRRMDGTDFGSCPAGALRMKGGKNLYEVPQAFI